MQVQAKGTCKLSQSRLRNIRVQEARNNNIHSYLRLIITQCFTIKRASCEKSCRRNSTHSTGKTVSVSPTDQ